MPQDQGRGRPCRCQSGADHLTDREIEVLVLVAAGRHNKQIAQELGISTRTVDHHLRTMLRRARAETRSELVARCYAAGILMAGTWPPGWSGGRCLR
jgi:DNA-binding CsgD family transcriptional regulator